MSSPAETLSIVDAHCHCTPIWYEPVESLLYQMDHNHVEKAILIQINGYYDNEYQFDCVRHYPDRLASVVMVDTQEQNALDQLERCAERGACGLRLHADTRSPGDDPLAIWRKASELGLAISCAGTPSQLASTDFDALVQALPDLAIIIEHLGGCTAWDPPETAALHERVFALAAYNNVHMKIHGLGEFCVRNMPVAGPFPFDRAGLPLLQRAYDAFGPERIMWGSDFPPVSSREGYANALHFTRQELADKPDNELSRIFGGTASRVFRLA
ncbi:MAG: amidohydrolase family protein [Caldilineaceae bacterium]